MIATSLPQVLRDNAVLILSMIALVSLASNIWLIRTIVRTRTAVRQARGAAEDAARAAALAAPGGIDPEAVIEVLRRGIPPTLDNVYAVMRRRDQTRAAEEAPAQETARAAT
jgi:hypothetical protein